MDIFIVMCAGILIGSRFCKRAHNKFIEILQLVCTLVLIFSMGVMLGKRENFFVEFLSLGGTSFVYFLIPTLLSTVFVYLLTKCRKNNRKNNR